MSQRTLKAMAIAGGAVAAAGVALAPERGWANLLLASFFLVSMGLAGIFFVALNYACAGGWSTAFRRIPEAMAAALPYGAAGIAAVLLFHPSLYPWTAPGFHAEGFQHVWLSRPFFLARAAVYLLLWMGFARLIVNRSRAQDGDGDLAHTHANVRLSAGFLVVFALTFWLAGYDWIMSLEPHWVSTIFGVYNFAGMFLAGLATIVLLVLWARRGPLADFVNEEHLHDLGKLLFAFSTFWMYIWFSQYMLIWYANIPEESVYYVRRLEGAWGPLFLLNVLLNWAIPFAVLLPRATKRNPAWLGRVAVVVLAGRWLDLHLMVNAAGGRAPALGLWEVGPIVAAAALFLLAFLRGTAQAAPAPLRDPYLVESLHYRN